MKEEKKEVRKMDDAWSGGSWIWIIALMSILCGWNGLRDPYANDRFYENKKGEE